MADERSQTGPQRGGANAKLANRLAGQSGRASTVVLAVGFGLAVIALVVAGYAVGYHRGGGGGGGGGGAKATTGGGSAKQMFVNKCGGCHTLSAAGTTGNAGPNLDQIKPPAKIIQIQIKNGGTTMPAGLASGKEVKAIADYVAKAKGGG